MLTKAVCMTGAEAAAQFYHPGRFTRRRAMPLPVITLIQDLGSVMMLDGGRHRQRKAMFLSLMGREASRRLAEITAAHWRARLDQWERMERVVLLDEAHFVLCRAVCEWAGIPLSEAEATRRAREFAAMIDGTGSVGRRNWRGHRKRARTERWARGIIRRVRRGELAVPDGSAAHVIARHRDLDGKRLRVRIAAVELINVLRPTVANARYVAFAAVALHEHPAWRERLRAEGDEELELFVQEVRRFYPFIPFIGGRVLAEFEWRGHRFAPGDWVLMDLYGTNHDPRVWDEPDRFRPERFEGWDGDVFNFIPQGGGDPRDSHRCPGEWITVEQVKAAARLLAVEMRYEVPEQDLRIDLTRVPALPESRFVMRNVRRVRGPG